MKKIQISLSITALLYLIITKNVNAAACTDVPSVGDYTVSEEDCYIAASEQVDGLDECLDGTESENNTSVLTIANGASLTIPIGSPTTNTTLVTGSITIGDDASISIGEYSNISIGAPLYMTDADGDWYPASLEKTLNQTANTQRVCGMNISDTVNQILTLSDIDSDDNDPETHVNCIEGNYYVDADGDGYGTGSIVETCLPAGEAGYATNNTDCHDTGTGANLVWVTTSCYLDSDNDNYGDQGATAKTCTNNATCASATAGSTGNGTTVSSSTNFSTTNDDCGINEANAFPGQTTYYGTSFTNSENAALVYDWNCDGTETKSTSPNLAYSCTPTAVTEKGCDNVRDKCTGGAYAIGTWNHYSAATFACGQTGCYSTGTYSHSCNCTWLANRSTCGFSSCSEIYASSPTVQTCL